MRPHRVTIGLRSGRTVVAVLVCAPVLGLAGCASGPDSTPVAGLGAAGTARIPAYNRPYQVRGRWYSPRAQPAYDQVGLASWYSYEAPSRRTSNGEPFDIHVASAAHTTLPIPSWLEVTNLDNGRHVRVRLNDRGPFVSTRILDVSRGAAETLGFLRQGTARVRVRYLGPAAPLGAAPAMWASNPPTSLKPPVRYAGAPAVPPPDPRAEVAEDSRSMDDGGQDDGDQNGARPFEPAAYGAAIAQAPPEPSFQGPVTPSGDGAGAFEVQAAAFSDRGNAERAVARLGAAGEARIRPLQRGEMTLYRVTVGAWADAGLASDARAQIVRLGFPDARVVSR